MPLCDSCRFCLSVALALWYECSWQEPCHMTPFFARWSRSMASQSLESVTIYIGIPNYHMPLCVRWDCVLCSLLASCVFIQIGICILWILCNTVSFGLCLHLSYVFISIWIECSFIRYLACNGIHLRVSHYPTSGWLTKESSIVSARWRHTSVARASKRISTRTETSAPRASPWIHQWSSGQMACPGSRYIKRFTSSAAAGTSLHTNHT